MVVCVCAFVCVCVLAPFFRSRLSYTIHAKFCLYRYIWVSSFNTRRSPFTYMVALYFDFWFCFNVSASLLSSMKKLCCCFFVVSIQCVFLFLMFSFIIIFTCCWFDLFPFFLSVPRLFAVNATEQLERIKAIPSTNRTTSWYIQYRELSDKSN